MLKSVTNYKGYTMIQQTNSINNTVHYQICRRNKIIVFGTIEDFLNDEEVKEVIDKYIEDTIKYDLFIKPLKFIKKIFRRNKNE